MSAVSFDIFPKCGGFANGFNVSEDHFQSLDKKYSFGDIE